jgi:hypothetical protein
MAIMELDDINHSVNNLLAADTLSEKFILTGLESLRRIVVLHEWGGNLAATEIREKIDHHMRRRHVSGDCQV